MKYIHYKSIIALSIIAILSSCNMKDKKEIANTVKTESLEANEHFTYKGKLINPCLLYDITENLLTTEENAIVAIDISYASTLRKYKEFDNDSSSPSEGGEFRSINYEKNSATLIWSKVISRYDDGTYEYDREEFMYTWLGKLKNGTHVIQTYSKSGGTMFAINLLFVKFIDDTFDEKGTIKNRLLLLKVNEISLGEPYDLVVKLDTMLNKVTGNYINEGGLHNALPKDCKKENFSIQL